MTARAPVRTNRVPICRPKQKRDHPEFIIRHLAPISRDLDVPFKRSQAAMWYFRLATSSCCDRTRPAATRGSGVIPHIGSWCPHFGLAPTRPPGHAATDEGRRPGPGARRPVGETEPAAGIALRRTGRARHNGRPVGRYQIPVTAGTNPGRWYRPTSTPETTRHWSSGHWAAADERAGASGGG